MFDDKNKTSIKFSLLQYWNWDSLKSQSISASAESWKCHFGHYIKRLKNIRSSHVAKMIAT